MFLLYYFFLTENGLNAISSTLESKSFREEFLQTAFTASSQVWALISTTRGQPALKNELLLFREIGPNLRKVWGESLSAASQGLYALPKKKTHPAPPRWSNCPEASVFSQVLISTGIRNSQPPTCGILKAQSCKALLMSSAAVSFSSRLGVGPTAVSFLFLTEGNILIQISHRSGVLVCFSRLADDRSKC